MSHCRRMCAAWSRLRAWLTSWPPSQLANADHASSDWLPLPPRSRASRQAGPRTTRRCTDGWTRWMVAAVAAIRPASCGSCVAHCVPLRQRSLATPRGGAAVVVGEPFCRCPGNGDRVPRLRVDFIGCDGRGMCAEILPDLIRLDDWGYPIVADREVPRELLPDAAGPSESAQCSHCVSTTPGRATSSAPRLPDSCIPPAGTKGLARGRPNALPFSGAVPAR